MPKPEVVVLIPESTRKARGGSPGLGEVDDVSDALPADPRARLEDLREEIREKSPKGSIDSGGLLPAFRRFQGNMYRNIAADAWERRVPNIEVLIVSGLRGLLASRDPVPAYSHSMAEPMPPWGKLNRWWHDRGLPGILEAYLTAIRPRKVVDLLSLEYRESVSGYKGKLSGIDVKTIDFPGMGRASQPRRGAMVAEILVRGKA